MSSSEGSRWRERLASIDFLALTGLAFSALFLVSLTLLSEEPRIDASAEEVRSWFTDRARIARTLTALNLVPLSIIAMLWYMAVLARQRTLTDVRLLATVFLGSGLLFAALYMAGMAALGVGAVMVEYAGVEPSPAAFRLARSLGRGLLSIQAARMGAVFIISTASLGMRAGILRKATVAIGYVLGAAMIIGTVFREPSPYLLPAWVAVASIDLLFRPRPQKPAEGAS